MKSDASAATRLQNISADDFDYDLPEDRIALFPLDKRDESKLLIFNQGELSESVFSSLPDHLPSGCRLLFNNTRVIRARLFFQRSTGAVIEILCLEPVDPPGLSQAFGSTEPVVWRCLVGNFKKWREPALQKEVMVQGTRVTLRVEQIAKEEETVRVRLSWNSNHTCADLIEAAGQMPLPPYIHREVVDSDSQRYQTVYSHFDGSVAAPTAGLHFTDSLLRTLGEKGVQKEEITLHIGAGTFKPVKAARIGDHAMHAETFSVPVEVIRRLVEAPALNVAVGTTSVRTMESLYWLGVKTRTLPHRSSGLNLSQWEAYDLPDGIDLRESYTALLDYATGRGLTSLEGATSLIIVPGYQFRVFDGLITNFHQPRSTLLMLVAAFTGSPIARIYQYALEHQFRFLSYGDSSLLWRNTP